MPSENEIGNYIGSQVGGGSQCLADKLRKTIDL